MCYNKNIMIFGGTFNPIHNGHLYIINQIKEQLKFDLIIVIPSNIPPHKINGNVSATHRFNMCKLALEDSNDILVDDIEIKRKGISYTFETLNELKKIYNNYNLSLIMGADMFLSFESWKNPQEILNLSKICVIPRGTSEINYLNEHKNMLKSNYKNLDVIILDVPKINISSTYIRDRIKENKNIDKLVPKRVKEYIYANNLYKRV